jgi:hypothetical protein
MKVSGKLHASDTLPKKKEWREKSGLVGGHTEDERNMFVWNIGTLKIEAIHSFEAPTWPRGVTS